MKNRIKIKLISSLKKVIELLDEEEKLNPLIGNKIQSAEPEQNEELKRKLNYSLNKTQKLFDDYENETIFNK